MDALSILALGVAQAGGGGGGGTSDYSDLSNKPQINSVTLSGNKSLSDLGIPSYTAGDNITINNNEISVDGLALEKEDRFVHDAVDKVEVSSESVNLSQEVNGNYTKGLSLNPSGTINGDDQTASKLFGISPSKLWFENYNLDRTVRLEPTSDYRNLAINGVPIGGGSSSGAVRYDEAQSLTDAQKNQAKANQELPYMTFVKTASASNIVKNAGTGAQQVSINSTFSNVPSSKIVGSKVYIKVSNANAQFEESAEGTFYNTTGNFKLDSPANAQYFNTANTDGFLGTSQLSFAKLNTSSLGFSGTTYFNVWVDVPTYNNKLSEKLVDSGLLSKVRVNNYTYGDISTDTGTNATKEDGVVNPSLMSISLGASASQSPAVNQYGINIGWDNRRGGNTRPITQIGHSNDTNVSGGITIGQYLNTATPYKGSDATITINNSSPTLETVTSSLIVLGQYNDNTAMKVTQADLPVKWAYANTYSANDLVLWGSANSAWVFKSLVDNNQGHQPPINKGQSNQYWEWVGESGKLYGYLFTLANGEDEQHRSNALTVDWSGNLVCNNIPACPSADGVYNLQVSIVSGVPTYSWVAQS